MASQYDLPYTGNQVETLLGKVSELERDIPEKVSDLQNDAGYITDADIPTDVSDFNNDAGYITNAPVTTETQRAQQAEGALAGRLDAVEGKIPSAASASNQLADKNFVNSSIATATATHRGTYNLVTDLGLTVSASQSQIAAAIATKLAALSITSDNNDYVFVQIPTANDKPTEIARIDRYKYNGASWAFEYSLNNSGFTAAQWAAINSGITSADVTKLGNLPTNAELTTLLNGKQDVISDLEQIRTNANGAYQKPSGGIPKTDLDSSVQTSLGKADSALQQHQDISGKADKDTDAVPGNVAKFDANGNPVDGGVPVANIAQKDGYYEEMSVGLAKNLEGRNNVTGSFLERTTGGDAEVVNGIAQITEVKGKSQVWNQLVQNGNFSDGTTGWSKSGSSVISAANNVLTWTTVDTTISQNVNREVKFVNGHKYYLAFSIKGDTENIITGGLGESGGGGLFVSIRYSTAWERIAKIVAPVTATSFRLYLRPNAGGLETQTTYFRNIIVLDLTLLGIDSLTTVAKVEAWLAENIGLQPYYPYNAGEVLNNKMKGIESLGFNILDPATNKARIIGAYSDVYGSYYGITGTHGTLTFTSDLGDVSEITPDSGGKFLIETPGWLDVATPSADCTVFFWWDGTRTEYEAYDKEVAGLDVTHIYGKLNGEGELVQVFPDGMAGINDVKDVLRNEDGVAVARKRIGVVDMGTLTWGRALFDPVYIFRADVQGVKTGANVGLLSAKYPVDEGIVSSYNLSDKSMLDSTSIYGRVFIRDDSYTDDATFKASMSGVPFYYELATEQLYTDLVYQDSDLFADGTPVTMPVPYQVNNWGLERIIPQNTSEGPVTAPPDISVKYAIDAQEQLDTIRTSGIFAEDLKANISALLSVVNEHLSETMGGTIAIGSTPTDKVYPFTFVPNPEPEPES